MRGLCSRQCGTARRVAAGQVGRARRRVHAVAHMPLHSPEMLYVLCFALGDDYDSASVLTFYYSVV